MDIFDLSAKITLDTKEYTSGLSAAESGASSLEDTILALRSQYAQSVSNVKALTEALNEYTRETGGGTGAAQELADMLAQEQQKAADAKAELDRLTKSQNDAGDSAEDAAGSVDELEDSEKKQGDTAKTAGEKTSSFSDKLKALGTAAKVAVGAITAVSTAAVGIVGVFAKSVDKVGKYGDAIDKNSQKMGISKKAYQEWAFILDHCGSSIDSLLPSMKTLATAAEQGNEAFELLGFSQEQIANLSQEDLFSQTIEALQNVSDYSERTYLASKLLGRGATELGPLLNTTADEVADMKNEVSRLGGVMSDEAVSAAAAYADSLTNVKTAVSGFFRNVFSQFLPGVSTLLDGISELLSGNEKDAQEKITAGVDEVLLKIEEVGPVVSKVLGTIFSGIKTAIEKNGNKILEKVGALITRVFSKIVEKAPKIVAGASAILEKIIAYLTNPQTIEKLFYVAGEIVTNLATGIANAIGSLSVGLSNLVDGIVKWFSNGNNLANLVSSAIDIVLSLGNFIKDNASKIISAAGTILEKLVGAFTDSDNLKKLINGAADILSGLIDGLSKGLADFTSKVPDIVGALIDGIIDNFDDFLTGATKIFDSLVKALTDPSTIGAIIKGGVEIGGKLVKGIVSKITDPNTVWEILEAIISTLTSVATSIPNAISGIITGFAGTPTDGAKITHENIVGSNDTAQPMTGNTNPNVQRQAYRIPVVAREYDENDEFFDKNKEYEIYDTDGQGALGEIVDILVDIRDRISGDVVLDSGEIVGYIDNKLGELSRQKARTAWT